MRTPSVRVGRADRLRRSEQLAGYCEQLGDSRRHFATIQECFCQRWLSKRVLSKAARKQRVIL